MAKLVASTFLPSVESLDESKALLTSDPAVQAGRLIMELHPWYGSTALMEVNAIHLRIARVNP